MADVGNGGGGVCGGGLRGGEVLNFAAHVVRGRWFSVFASFLIMAGAGATYLFGIYSKQIKASLAYDQTTLNLVGFSKDLGANVGVLSGLIAEVTPTWFVLLVGSALNLGGYLMIWLAVTARIPRPRVWHMCLYICVGANSQNFANTGALVTCVKNFPESRGVMLGLLKGFVGLSGAVMTQIYLAVYGDDPKSLILLIAWLPAAISVVFVYTIRPMGSARRAKDELRVFYRFLYISIALALFLMAATIAQKLVAFPRAAYPASAAVVCILLFLPLAVAVREELAIWDSERRHPSSSTAAPSPSRPKPASYEDNAKIIKLQQEQEQEKDGGGQPWWANVFRKPDRGEDYTILQALLSVDMLVLFVATFCGLGGSLTAVDNLGQIGESLGYPARTVSSFVSLVSIWNYFGRVCAGFTSEILLARYGFPRPLMMTLVLLLACVGHLLIAFPVPGAVYVASVVIGFSFGAQLPLLFAIISELFGLKYYSTLFNCGQLASPLGSYVLNVKVTGMLYDREARRQLAAEGMSRAAAKELTCMGKHCYQLAFVVLASVTMFGAAASLVLVMRTREFYRGDIYKKFREEVEKAEVEMTLPASRGRRSP